MNSTLDHHNVLFNPYRNLPKITQLVIRRQCGPDWTPYFGENEKQCEICEIFSFYTIKLRSL